MVHTCFDKKLSSANTSTKRWNKLAGSTVKIEIMSNHDLAEQLHKPIIRKFEKTIIHASFVDNFWGARLLISN